MGTEGLALTPKQDYGTTRALWLSFNCTPPPHPWSLRSLLPLPKHLRVLGIFRPQLTGCEIAPFAPPQPGGGWRGRNEVGEGHTDNSLGSSQAGRCQAGREGLLLFSPDHLARGSFHIAWRRMEKKGSLLHSGTGG